MFLKEEKTKWVQERIESLKRAIAYVEHRYKNEMLREKIKGPEIEKEILEGYLIYGEVLGD